MYNKVQLIGRLGKDPETKPLSNGTKVSNFSLATCERYKKDGETKEITEWHNVVIYGKLADIADKYLRKGATVFIEGKIRTRNWESDGRKVYATEIVADNFKMLDGKKDEQQNQPRSQAEKEFELPPSEVYDDQLPF